jgi:hypothetical protein
VKNKTKQKDTPSTRNRPAAVQPSCRLSTSTFFRIRQVGQSTVRLLICIVSTGYAWGGRYCVEELYEPVIQAYKIPGRHASERKKIKKLVSISELFASVYCLLAVLVISLGGDAGVRRLRECASLIWADGVGSTKCLCRNNRASRLLLPTSVKYKPGKLGQSAGAQAGSSCRGLWYILCVALQISASIPSCLSPFRPVATQRPCLGRQYLVPASSGSCNATPVPLHHWEPCYRVSVESCLGAFLSCYHVYCTNYEAMPFPLDPCFLCVHMPIS